MDIEAAKKDDEYEDAVVSVCKAKADGDGWFVTFTDGWSLWVRDESGVMGEPPIGACLRKFGQGIAYTVRGVGRVIDGKLVGLYRYRTKTEEALRVSRRSEQGGLGDG